MQRELRRGRKREILDREPEGRFRPNNTGGGPPGTPNKVSRTLRECVLMAGEIVGSDGKGRDGLLDYLVRIARRDPKTFCGLLGRLLPVDLRSHGGRSPSAPSGPSKKSAQRSAARHERRLRRPSRRHHRRPQQGERRRLVELAPNSNLWPVSTPSHRGNGGGFSHLPGRSSTPRHIVRHWRRWPRLGPLAASTSHSTRRRMC